ncbi:MAG: hypothetical protein EOP21_09575 [Hyphomicrobiales bacterium]|nr:MAG: hypothetical protein EOP21_09575 [Hyphomicrobiales bacterium]
MNLAAGLARMIARQELPEIVAWLDGVAVGRARPMIGDRVWLSNGASDLLAGAVGLIEQCVARYEAGLLATLPEPVRLPRQRSGSDLLLRYLPNLIGGLVRRRIRRLRNRPFYWQTAYRRVEGQGVVEEGALSGAPFALLPDDGKRFFADPFVIEREGRTFLFVEEFPYALARGVISVAELGEDGRFGLPRQVLVEPHHLSYPQVFELGGEVWMIPETSSAGQVVLYRAEQFPDRWVRHATLIADREISDATLLERDGRFWLFGTERHSQGNPSDTMVVFSADRLEGPWLPHPMNPVLIDPAVYYGDRNMDLAMTTLFGGFEKEFYDSYQYHSKSRLNENGIWQICNLYPLLIHLNLFGRAYLSSILSTLRQF